MTSLRALLSCALVASLVPTAGQAGFDLEDKAMKVAYKSAEAAIKEAVKDLFKRDTMNEAQVKAARKLLKEQRKFIEGRKGLRKNIRTNLVSLVNGQNNVRIMEDLLNCLEAPEGKNSFTYNAIADDRMRDLKNLRKSLSRLNSDSLIDMCNAEIQEFEKHFKGRKGIQKTVSINEKLPALTMINVPNMVVYSEQDVRDLFQYYIAHLNRVIVLHENFARQVDDIRRISTNRLQKYNIEIPQEILDSLDRQRKLALFKVQQLSQNVLERGGESGEEPLYTFPSIKRLNVLMRYTADTDLVETFLNKDKPYKLEPYPLALELPDTFTYIETIKQKAFELGDYIPPEGEDENVNLEFEMDQNINEIIAFIDAAIDRADEEIKSRQE